MDTRVSTSWAEIEARVPRWEALPDPRKVLRETDPEVYEAIEGERRRQWLGLELIASENYVSPAVLAAAGRDLLDAAAAGAKGRTNRERGPAPSRLPQSSGRQ